MGTKKMLAKRLGLFDMTFPQIIVKGKYVGGSDDVLEYIDKGEWGGLLKETGRVYKEDEIVVWDDKIKREANKPRIFSVPKINGPEGYPDWPWWRYEAAR